MSKTRDVTIDLLRGTAAICMVLGHSFIVHPINISDIPWCSAVQHVIYTFHMELFFILAGWVYRCKDYKGFIVNKVKRILIPYAVFGIFALLIKAVGSSAVNGVEPISLGIKKFLLYGGGYWFLYTLFLVCVIYPLLERILGTVGRKAALLILLLVLDQFVKVPALLALNKVVQYLPYFILGDIIKAVLTGGIREKLQKYWWVGSIAALGVYVGIEVALSYTGHGAGVLLSYTRAVAFCAFLFFIADRLRNAKGIFMRFMTDCSKYSLQLYLFDGWIMTVLRTLLCSVLHITNPFVIVSVILVGVVASTLFACKVVLPWLRFAAPLCGIPNAPKEKIA